MTTGNAEQFTLPQHFTEADLRLFVRLIAHQNTADDICNVLSISAEEYEGLCAIPAVEQAIAEARKGLITQVVDTEEGWDDLESKAIARTKDLLHSIDSAESAARVAAIANKAQRNGPRRQQGGGLAPPDRSASYNNGVLQNPKGEVLAQFENLRARELKAVEDAPRRGADVVGVKDIEAFMREAGASDDSC